MDPTIKGKKATIVEVRCQKEDGEPGMQTIVPPSVRYPEEAGEVEEKIVWYPTEADNPGGGDRPAEITWDELIQTAYKIAIAVLLERYWPGQGGHDNRLAAIGFLSRAIGDENAILDLMLAVPSAWPKNDADHDVHTIIKDTAKRLANGDKTVKGAPKFKEAIAEHVGAEKAELIVNKLANWLQAAYGDNGAIITEGPCEWPDPTPLQEQIRAASFPLCVLPHVFCDFTKAASEAIQCPTDFSACAVLMSSAGALGNARALQIKQGHIQAPSFYLGCAGPPGTAKTPSAKASISPLLEMEMAEGAAYEIACDEFEAKVLAHKDQVKQWRETAPGERGALPKMTDKKPARPRLLTNDVTVESVGPILVDNPRGVLIHRDELTAFVASLNQYRNSGLGADQQFYMSTWSGAPIIVDRKGKHDQGPIRVPHPHLSIFGGLVPDNLIVMRGNRRNAVVQDGFIDRFLFSYPETGGQEEENYLELKSELTETYAIALRNLRKLETDKGKPTLIGWAGQGREAWRDFTRRHAAEMNDASFPEHLKGPWVKLKAYCARFALLLHYLRWAGRKIGDIIPDGVDEKDLLNASLLIDYFKNHAKRVYSVIDADWRVRPARRVLAWLAAHREDYFAKKEKNAKGFYEVGRNELHQKVWGGSFPIEDGEKVFDLLVLHNNLRPIEIPPRTGPGRRPSPRYEIHPLSFSPENLSQFSQFSRNEDGEGVGRLFRENCENCETCPQRQKNPLPTPNLHKTRRAPAERRRSSDARKTHTTHKTNN
jgi:hypothetical protein